MNSIDQRRSGAREFRVSLLLVLLAWLVMTGQELFLFLRPTPYGGAYVRAWGSYFGRALEYNLLGVLLIALPFTIRWLTAYRGEVSARSAARWHTVQLILLTLTVGLDHADNEVERFLGTHLTLSLLRTYERVGAWGSDMLHVFTTDRGGPWLPFILLFAGMTLYWWLGRRVIRKDRRGETLWRTSTAWALAVVPVTGLLVVYNTPGGHFPRNRARPEVITLGLELLSDSRSSTPPADLPKLVSEYQAQWLAADRPDEWTFAGSSRYPLLRVPLLQKPEPTRWNVILLQLETFRGWDVGFHRPDRHPSPTPFLDSLAAQKTTASWTSFLSFGPPTVNGFIANHCSAQPHSSRNISTTYTAIALNCLPAVLRHHGWHTAFFTGSDPDWDNQTIWLSRWYDESSYYPDADELDREVFARALKRIRELGNQSQPFMATVVSISNHYPFRSRESKLDLNSGGTPADAILNTMHYTDDVVRQFVDSLAREPWFGNTLLVIVGDHGYNLGEHDGTPGQRNGWRESVWVPFLIHGAHPRLPSGRHGGLASQLDLAPTITDLLGIRDTTSWMGHSLVNPPARDGHLSLITSDVFFSETPRWSLVVDLSQGIPHLYDRDQDPLQRSDLVSRFPAEVSQLEGAARHQQSLWDILVEFDRIWPQAGARTR